jgi:hypothetical protein
MKFFEILKRAFGLEDGQPVAETSTPDDEETKTSIEIDADEAEELLRQTTAKQKAGTGAFSQQTVDLHGRLSDIMKSEGTDDGHVHSPG